MSPGGRIKILLIDEDAALLDLLRSLLEEQGYVIETVSGLEGFTPELMALSQPKLVFLNPRMSGLGTTVLRGLLDHFRRLSPRALVMLTGPWSPESLQTSAQQLKADGYVPTRELLENPSGQVPVAVVQAPPAPAAADRPRVSEMDAEEILDLELEVPEPPPPRAVPARPHAPAGVALGHNLVKLIEEEVEVELREADAVPRFDVPLDVMTEHNLYGPGPGVVRGVFVAASVRPEKGATVEMVVGFPWGTRYELLGTVEWTLDLPRLAKRTRGGFGVKLPELTPLQRAMFNRFMGLRTPMVMNAPK